MVNRFIGSLRGAVTRSATESASLAINVRNAGNRFFKTAHYTLTVTGVVAIAALCTMIVKPHFADQFKALSPFAVATSQADVVVLPAEIEPMDMPSKKFVAKESTADAMATNIADKANLSIVATQTTGDQVEQKWVTNWISKRYRVASDAANMLVSAAYVTAKDTKLDPLLILSVMAIESGFNPFAESAGGAQGLMQVMSKVHYDKFRHLGGIKAALNPVANIKVGSLILKDYVTRGGSVEAGLKMYVGAAAFQNDSGYGSKVMAEYHRLKEVANGKSVPITVFSAAPVQKPRQQDSAIAKPADPVEAVTVPQVSPDIAVTNQGQVAVL